ncbi:uncharacterized protein F4812DRAFT_433122 [Daldinia caldariorum]|uniref:uncharacterized protein n=1 Tax=Daldinia caldariorum TaxID=326644 RepID=UPI0020076C3B|nr:uncharacterized protein F4812DRAFT_433122 [Daldinia caldariorum]KAI1466880.1 hypothetical protein F4812DRAFT_433122 [Daldinia caldariorum]
MDGEQIEKWRIEIPLPSKPPPYRPGDGPPLAPLRILPEHDTDAFIVDKRVLPGTAPNGELKLYMYYIVGWPDLPAARVSVLATDIYNYVSPRAVEDFEYKALLERDEEEERREAEEKRRMELEAKRKLVTSTSTAPSNPAIPISGQRRRGRPSKAELQSRQLAQQSSFNISQSIEAALPPANTSGPSLSTPQKKLVGEIATDLEEEADEADPEDAIYRQLCGYNDDPFEDMDIDDDRRDGDIPLDNLPETMSSSSEFRSYARTLWLNKDSTLFKRTNGSLALKSSTSHVPVPEVLRSNTQPPLQPSPPRTETYPSIIPVPIPPPYNIDRSTTAPQLHNPKHSITPVPVPTPLRSNKEAPQPKPPDAKHPITPVPVPSWPRLANKNDTQAPISQDSPDSPQYRGFTPAGRSSGRWPSAQSHSGDIPTQTSPLTTQQIQGANHTESPQRRKPYKPKSAPQKEDEQAKVWVVERLEGDRVMNVGGKHVHYFKVRWAGDWPPDQNPTWEPEENITPALVKAYLKKKAARHAAKPPNKSNSSSISRAVPPLYPPTLKRKYSSVAEAFAGEEDDDPGEAGSSRGQNEKRHTYKEEDDNNDGGEDGEEGEMLVVAADQEIGYSRKGPRLRPRPEDLGAVFMRDLAAAIRLGDEKGGSR